VARSEYFEHLVDPVMAGLSASQCEEVPIIGYVKCQAAVDDEVDKVDWDSTGLPNQTHTIEGNAIEMEPVEAAKYLVHLAFEDALWLTIISETYAQADSELSKLPMEKLLIDSKKNLLLYGRIPDDHRVPLRTAMENPHIADSIVGAPDNANDPLITTHDKSVPRIDWSQPIRQWFEQSIEKERGCPAFQTIVEFEGNKTTLLYHFWEKLMHVMYAEATQFQGE
jgi:hypothetical protein